VPGNPYSPPGSRVDEPPGPPRPPQVTRACQILWAVIALSVAVMHPEVSGEWWVLPDEAGAKWMVIMVAVALAWVAAYVVLVWLVGQRQNWARWMLLAAVAASTLFGMYDFESYLAETPLAALASLLFTLLEIWAFALLFFGPGAQWFRQAD